VGSTGQSAGKSKHETRNEGNKAPAREIFPQRGRAATYGSYTVLKLNAMGGCDDMEAALNRLRELLKDAESYRKQAFYESVSYLFLEIALALDGLWEDFEEIMEGLPE